MEYVLLGVGIVALIVPIALYNLLISRRNQIRNIEASTDALLKKRYDLVPNLVETVKGYAKHEKEVFERVTQLRSEIMIDTGGLAAAAGLHNQLAAALGGILALAENYPDLKASDNFLHLQRSLMEIEEQISAARRAFNASVTSYNNVVETFPSNVIAGIFGFRSHAFFSIDPVERGNRKIAMNKVR